MKLKRERKSCCGCLMTIQKGGTDGGRLGGRGGLPLMLMPMAPSPTAPGRPPTPFVPSRQHTGSSGEARSLFFGFCPPRGGRTDAGRVLHPRAPRFGLPRSQASRATGTGGKRQKTDQTAAAGCGASARAPPRGRAIKSNSLSTKRVLKRPTHLKGATIGWNANARGDRVSGKTIMRARAYGTKNNTQKSEEKRASERATAPPSLALSLSFYHLSSCTHTAVLQTGQVASTPRSTSHLDTHARWNRCRQGSVSTASPGA
jgi:hypothetical protein